jgi:glutamate synthase (NADPH) small chain
LVVWAVREGQDAAADIHHYLKTQLLAAANDGDAQLAGVAE